MATLWLPFYDLGGSVGPNQTNANFDAKLYLYLAEKFLRTLSHLRERPAPAVSGKPGETYMAFVAKHLKAKGYSVKPCPAGPLAAGDGETIRALNEFNYKHYPDEHAYEKFEATAGGAGSVTSAMLVWLMCQPACWRSDWTGRKATAAGPQIEMPFYDLGAPFGWGKPNFADDWGLVTRLLIGCNYCYPALFPMFSFPGNGVAFSPAVVPVFASIVQAQGWPVADPTAIHPAYGNPSAASLIRPLNYYTQKGGASGGLTVMPNLCVDPSAPAGLKASMKTNRKSLYFKYC